MAIVFLLSGSYCHGEALAQGLVESLGLVRADQALADLVAERYGVTGDRLARSLRGERSLLNRFTHEQEKTVAFVRVCLAELLARDNLLFHGCIGPLVPRTIVHVLQICAIANLDYRVQQAAAQEGIDAGDALAMVRAKDDDSVRCISALTGKSPFDESLYDMVLPMHDRSVPEAIALIREQAASPAVQTTERSKQAVTDFLLAARVRLALVAANHDCEVFAENGEVVVLLNEYVIRQAHLEEQVTALALKVEGVTGVSVRLGPKFAPPSLNPWANIEPPPKFLLVDDEKEFVHTLSERLQTRDLKSSIAYDGEQALDLLQSELPDVIVLDLKMPGIDGIEVLRRVKADHPEVEVIILTGHGSDLEREQAEALGAFAYLQKPANIDELARVMKEAYQKATRHSSAPGSDRGNG